MQKKHNRRYFLKSASVVITAAGLGLWKMLISTQQMQSVKKKISVSTDQPGNVTFFDDFILIQKDDESYVLSNLCPHLGCSISKLEEGKLICPCHGSSFNLDGEVLTGPAINALKKPVFSIDKINNMITVEI
ncbi:MAG: Rieske (2Fe-2S) protein [Bacteroidetes bacterium]|nr:Rieske (2Fe-2S) protein [Bacteroidota bacterium]